MGYELRRQLREALGPNITGLQRAVALEIADDAREDSRRSFVTLEELARWTGAKDAIVIRNALKRLASAGWEFRVPIGSGKDGRTLYAVPGRRMTFTVPSFEEVAPATPKGEPPLPQGVATAHSEEATAHSEGATATPSSSDPSSHQEEEDASAQGGAPATPKAPTRDLTAEEKKEFGNFWALYPKSRDMEKTRSEWTAAVLGGVPAEKITTAAVAYAREKTGEEFRFIKYSVNWLKARGYEDDYEPGPQPGRPNLRAVSGGHVPFRNPTDDSVWDEDLI